MVGDGGNGFGITKAGAGQLNLGNAADTYGGVTTITAGILGVADLNVVGSTAPSATPDSLGSSSNAATNLVINGANATLQYNGSSASTTDRQFTLGASGGTLDASGTTPAATVTFTSTAALGGTGNRNFILTGTNTGVNTLSAILNLGTGNLTKNGVGTWLLNQPASTYTGVTTINAGILEVSKLALGGQPSSIGASTNAATNLLLVTGGTLEWVGSANDTTDRVFTLGTATAGSQIGVINASSASNFVTFSSTTAVAIGGTSTAATFTLSGTGGTATTPNIFDLPYNNNGTGVSTFTKSGTGAWQLNGVCNYTGVTSILGGTLDVTNLQNGGTPSNIGAAAVLGTNLVINGGTLRFVGSGGVNNSTSDLFQVGGVVIGGTATVDASGATGTPLTFSGSGALVFGTTNQARTLTLTGTNGAGTSDVNVFSPQINNNGTGLVSFTKAGTGTWELNSSNNAYTGVTTITGGGILEILTVSNAGANSTIGAAAVAASNLVIDASTLDYIGTSATSTNRGFTIGAPSEANVSATINASGATGDTLTFSGGTIAFGTASVFANLTLTGTNSNINLMGNVLGTDNVTAGSTSLTKTGTGTWAINVADTYTGATTISAGVLQIGNAGTTGSLSPNSNITDNGALTFNLTNTITQGTGFGTIVAGTGTLNQAGTGTTILTASNTYVGTNITAGILQVGNGGATGSLGSGAIAVASPGTLAFDFSTPSTYNLGSANLVTGTGAVTLESTGPVVASVNNQFNTTGALNFGAANASTTVSSLNLTNGGSTFGSILVRTNSTATPNTITLGSNTLTVTNGLTLGYDAGTGTGPTQSNLTVTGGTFAITGGAVNISVNQAATNAAYWSQATLDVTGTSSFTANVTNFNVGVGTTTSGAGTVLLSNTANTIIATTIDVGDTGGNNGPGVGSFLTLGTGTNVIQANTIDIGRSKGSGPGTVAFASQVAGSPGTVTINNAAGTGPAVIDIGDLNGTNTGGGAVGTLNLFGHTATVSASTVTLANNNNTGVGGTTGTLDFDTGTFTVSTALILAPKTAAGIANATATLNVAGGSFTVNSGATFTLGSEATAGTSTATLNLTGGTFTSNANILNGGGATTSTINLNGGILNLVGNTIGSANTVVLNAQSGTLENVSQVNNGGTVTKTTAGTLTVAGTNTWTGATAVSAGTMVLVGGANPTLGNTAVTVSNNATLDISGNTAIGLAAGGTSTVNANVGSTFSLLDSTINTLTFNAASGATAFTIGAATGTAVTLGFDTSSNGTLGSTDLIAASQKISLGASGAQVTLNSLTGAGLQTFLPNGTYNLITFAANSSATGSFTFQSSGTQVLSNGGGRFEELIWSK